jgi:hypothetical protein
VALKHPPKGADGGQPTLLIILLLVIFILGTCPPDVLTSFLQDR